MSDTRYNLVRNLLAFKVFDREIGCRRWSTVFVVMEVGQCYPVTIQLLVDQCQHCTRTSSRPVTTHDVCHCSLLHNDLHDLRGLWERCGRDRQREDFYHLHDDHCWYGQYYRRFSNSFPGNRHKKDILDYSRLSSVR